MSPALVDKHVNVRRHPCELGHPRADLLVKTSDSLLEQSTLLGVQTEQDAVVVTDDQQDVLPEHAQGLTLLVHLGSVVWHLEAKPLPVVHLVEEADQVSTEVGTDHPAAGPTERRTIHFLCYFTCFVFPLAPPIYI